MVLRRLIMDNIKKYFANRFRLILVGLFCFLMASPLYAEKTLYFVHNDHLNTPQVLTNNSKNIVWQVDNQTPFGRMNVNEDPDGDGEIVEFNLRFPGQYYDKETGFHYNYFRYYDPSLGRYITSDPIGLEGGLNTYGYVYQNPLNWTDSSGLAPKDKWYGYNDKNFHDWAHQQNPL